ncbi:TetR/AcrR family transcriptional regulator [Mycolicibacterium sp. 22603]|uniref:TetR/AcrR family transcriptional regulator n=1 Tax=Mycolicibacterium sp. 22603 TaxID=3453950 RepID=UPI003F872400
MAAKLPPGRHRLTREEVAADQRRRMITALGEVLQDKGFAGTTVTDISERARVSKQTFYEHYDSKQACFLDAYARIHDRVSLAASTLPAKSSPLDVFSAVLTNYLDTLSRDPAMARVYLVEVYAAGPEALHARMQLQQRTVDSVQEVFGIDDEEGRFACRALVAAIASLTTHELADSDSGDVRSLHAPLVALAARLFDA